MTLAIYKSWADNLLYSSISELTDSELKQERAMLFGNILSLLHHVYALDIVWKSNLEEVPEVRVSFKELRTNQIELNAWYEGYFAHLSREKHTEKVAFNYIECDYPEQHSLLTQPPRGGFHRTMIYCGRGLSASYYDHNVKEEQLFASIDRNI